MDETLETQPPPVNGLLRINNRRNSHHHGASRCISVQRSTSEPRAGKLQPIEKWRIGKLAQPLQCEISKNHYDLTLNVERQVSRESGTRTKASSLGNRWDAFFVVEKFRAGRTAAVDWHGERA